MQLNCTWSYK